MKSIGKLGQNKILRLSNDRIIADKLSNKMKKSYFFFLLFSISLSAQIKGVVTAFLENHLH
jgi:hypothetical protein